MRKTGRPRTATPADTTLRVRRYRLRKLRGVKRVPLRKSGPKPHDRPSRLALRVRLFRARQRGGKALARKLEAELGRK
jgi:hypothetical protein